MNRDEFIKAVTKLGDDHGQKLSLEDYAEACDELADYFLTARDAAHSDLEHEDA